MSSRAPWTTGGGTSGGGGCHGRPSSSSPEVGDGTLLQELAVTANRTEKEATLLAHFNISNCANCDQSSTVEEDDLLVSGGAGSEPQEPQ